MVWEHGGYIANRKKKEVYSLSYPVGVFNNRKAAKSELHDLITTERIPTKGTYIPFLVIFSTGSR